LQARPGALDFRSQLPLSLNRKLGFCARRVNAKSLARVPPVLGLLQQSFGQSDAGSCRLRRSIRSQHGDVAVRYLYGHAIANLGGIRLRYLDPRTHGSGAPEGTHIQQILADSDAGVEGAKRPQRAWERKSGHRNVD
jgi:hypothetical protein